MKRVLILALMLFVCTNSGNCATTFFPPLQPFAGTGNAIQDNTVDSANLGDSFTNPLRENYPNLGKIEQTLFGRAYDNQNINTRLSRIENALFTTTYPNSTSAQRIDNIISNFNQINKNPNISKNVLSRLESRVFNQSFMQNSPQRRIERLEEQIFGAVQTGELDARCKALQLAAKTYNKNNSFSDDFSDPMTSSSFTSTSIPMSMSMPMARGRGLGGFLSNFTSGSMTGFTPNINPFGGYNNYNRYSNPYNRYNPYLGNQRPQQGYRAYNGTSNYGSGAGVTILD